LKQRKKQTSQLERRYITSQSGTLEVRTGSDGKKNKIAGYAAKFIPALSEDLGGWREQLDPHCFDACLSSGADARGLWNHDANHVLGSTKSGTMRIKADGIGLYYEIDAPDTQMARDLMTSIQRKDVTSSSFGFTCSKDSWSQLPDGTPLRTVLVADVFDCSPCTFPAYPDATTGLRAALRSAPADIRARLSVRDDSDQCEDGQHYDSDLGECVSDDDDSDDSDSDDRSMSYRRCSFRCAQHRDIDAGWDQIAGFADDDDSVRCQARCAMRCGSCERCVAMHSNVGLGEDDPMETETARAYKHLLSLRR
jgi:HK97 family phage prohead protease